MNMNELAKLARDATGGGVEYTVSVKFTCRDQFDKPKATAEIWRWDSINHTLAIFNDESYQLMRRAETETSNEYHVFADGIKMMQKDALLLAPKKELESRFSSGNAQGNRTRRRILECIQAYIKEHGYSPSHLDITLYMDQSYTGTTLIRHLELMRNQGLINYKDGAARSITVNEEAVKEWLKSLDTV